MSKVVIKNSGVYGEQNVVSHLETRITAAVIFFLRAFLPLHNSLIVVYQLRKTVHGSMYSRIILIIAPG